MINPYHALAQRFSFLSPTIYKSRFYKKLILLTPENVFERNVEPEFLWLKDFLSQKEVFLDIGAGVGDYIYHLDYILFPENIYGFEPNQKLCKRLKKLFPKMNFYPIGLLDESKDSVLYIPMNDEEHHEKGTFTPIPKDEEDVKVFSQKAPIMRLDDWANENELLRLDFVKIDVVGQEILVLEGAKDTIKRYRPTLMVKIEQEYHEQDIWEVISKIEMLGYTAHYLHREDFHLKILTQDILEKYNAAVKKESSRYIKNIIFINNIL